MIFLSLLFNYTTCKEKLYGGITANNTGRVKECKYVVCVFGNQHRTKIHKLKHITKGNNTGGWDILT
jgi:hypothetical protein